MIDEQPPACRASYPDAQDVSLVSAGHDRADLAANLLLHFGAGFVAKRGRGKRAEDFPSRARLSVGVRPGEIRVQDSADDCSITFGGSLDKFMVGL